MRRLTVGMLAVSMAAWIGYCGVRANAQDNSGVPTPASLLSDDIVGVVIARPAKLWNWPLLQKVLVDTQTKDEVEQQLDFASTMFAHPSEIDRVTIFLDKKTLAEQAEDQAGVSLADPAQDPDAGGRDRFGQRKKPSIPTMIVETNKPIDWQRVKRSAPKLVGVKTHGQHQYLVDPAGVAMTSFGDRCLLITHESLVPKILEQNGASTKLGKKLAALSNTADAALIIDLGSHRQMSQAASQQVPMGQDLVEVDMLMVSANPTGAVGQSLLTIELTARDDAAATKLQQKYGPMIDQAKALYAQASQANPLLATPIIKDFVNGLAVKQTGNQLVIDSKVPEGLDQAVTDMITPALLSAKQAAEEAAKAASRSNDMKQIVLAMHNYHDVNGKLPSLGNDEKDNKLSWRVHLLPYMEERVLYEKFDFNAAWDSPQNMALLEQMPVVFATPGVDKPGMTSVHAFDGDNTPLSSKQKTSFGSVTDGLSYTGFFFVGGPDAAVPWTKPGGIALAETSDPRKDLGTIQEDFILVGMGDGSVLRLPKDFTQLREAITRDGGEVIDFP